MKQVDLKHMRKISIIWGIIMFLLIIGVTAIGIIYKNESKNYKEFEMELVDKAKDYIIVNNLNKVTISELKEQNIIETSVVNEKECDGYILKEDEEYKAYVKCGSYKTRGYRIIKNVKKSTWHAYS